MRLRHASPRQLTARCGALLAAVGTALLLLTAAPAAAAPDGSGWSTPRALSGNDPRTAGWFPTITTDLYGQVHVMWQGRPQGRPAAKAVQKDDRMSDGAGWLMYARQSEGTWSAARDIGAIGDETDALRTAVAADDAGRLHLLYRGLDLVDPEVGGAENEPIRYASVDVWDAPRPEAWSAGMTFSRRKPAYFADIAVDSQGVIHALTTEADGNKQYGVFYRRSTDGGKTWSLPAALEGLLAASRWRLQLKIGPRDDLNAVWEVVDGDDPSSRAPVGFIYARSTDGGDTWSTTTFAPPRTGYVYPKEFEGTGWRVQPAVGVDGRGQIVLVWREQQTDTIYFQRSADGREWSAPARVGGITRGVARPFDRYDMALDSAGRLHLVMVAYPERLPYMALVHTEWLDYTWSAPEIVATGATSPFPEWPRIAVSEGNRLHVVWFGGNIASVDRIPIGIWYATRTTSAPAVAALPRPTSVPATVAQAATTVPTTSRTVPTPVPTRAIAASQPPGELDASDDLQPDVWPLVLGIAAACMVVGAYVLHRRVS